MTDLQVPSHKTVRADSAGDHFARLCAGSAPDDRHAPGGGGTGAGQPRQQAFGLCGELYKYSTAAIPYLWFS